MPVWAWFLIAAAIILIAGLIIGVTRSLTGRRRTQRLQERFGPEYERTVAETGEQGAAEKELAARERKRKKLDIVELSPAAREGYTERWRVVQSTFVDDPSGALAAADELVTHVMRDRGYPVDDFEQQASDISVDHPTVVQNYRAGHGIYRSQQHGDVGTEERRQAFVHYRGLFEELLAPHKGEEESVQAPA